MRPQEHPESNTPIFCFFAILPVGPRPGKIFNFATLVMPYTKSERTSLRQPYSVTPKKWSQIFSPTSGKCRKGTYKSGYLVTKNRK